MDLAIDRKMVILQGGPLSGHVVYTHEKTKEYHIPEAGIIGGYYHVYKIKDIFGQYKGVKNETRTDN